MFNITQTRRYQDRSTTTSATLFAAVTLMLLLNACTSSGAPRPLNLADNFGNAVRQNMAVQVINPDATGPDESDRIDGQSAERALESQRARSVESEPESLILSVGGGS
ncbi:MAG: hypothetical protein WD071_07110 [Pseudohongiella sp.]|uniref:hypothetical protein n=1 Tax=Pseudohongiella sp. TaxID=1979412 RepID=UPI0034A039C6